MDTLSGRMKPIGFLYISFLLFIVMTFTNNSASAINIYIINLIFITVLVGYFIVLDGINLKLNLGLSVGVILCGVYIITMPVFGTHIYPILLFLKIVILIIFFRRIDVSDREIVNFLNYSFAIYLLISVFFWVFLPDYASSSKLNKSEFTVHVFGLSYQVLPGINGSPAHIDTYSAVILIVNFTIRANQNLRKMIMLFSVVGIVLSLRLTPIVGLLFVFILKPLICKKYFFILFNLLGFSAFTLLIILLHNIPDFMLADMTSLSDIAYLGTHARSQIWVMQTEIMLNTYDVYQYIFGGYQVDKFSVPLLQLWGAETGRFSSNPHNNYLMLLFISPLLFVYMLFVFYWYSFKYLSKQHYLLFTFILLACYTNYSLISLENPIYLYLFIYLIVSSKKKVKLFKGR